jgi:5-methylcytosine-specific restriction protein A
MMGSGVVTTESFLSPHWSGDGHLVPRVIIEFDALLHPDRDELLSLNRLEGGELSTQLWTPQASGISISDDVLGALESEWFNHLVADGVNASGLVSADDHGPATCSEGTRLDVRATRYERNPHARKACIDHYGLSCVACGFNFEATYGDIGRGFIHVHHLTPVSAGERSTVDPVKDLRPVCPNCHAMAHRETPPIDLDRLASMLRSD